MSDNKKDLKPIFPEFKKGEMINLASYSGKGSPKLMLEIVEPPNVKCNLGKFIQE